MDKHNRPADRGKKSQHTDIYEQLRRVQQAGILDPCAYAPADFIGIFPYSYRAGEKIILIDGNKRTTLISSDGLPHGPYPRLIMMWIGKEVLRRKKILPSTKPGKYPWEPLLPTSCANAVPLRRPTLMAHCAQSAENPTARYKTSFSGWRTPQSISKTSSKEKKELRSNGVTRSFPSGVSSGGTKAMTLKATQKHTSCSVKKSSSASLSLAFPLTQCMSPSFPPPVWD